MAVSAIASASDIQMDYMKLLLVQLQNQNPLEPMSNNEMASQLAQFSQLQRLESLSSSFADVLTTTNRNYANSLIGKDVSYILQDELTGAIEKKWGTVGEVYDVEGENVLVIDRHNFALKDIADSLVGKEVLFFAETQDGTREIQSGIVYGVRNGLTGANALIIDGRAVGFQDVIANSLVGQNISFVSENEATGALENKICAVNEVYKNAIGESILVVGRFLDLGNVISVKD
jgi:flagellar basal-body rod modification protein FlgD